MRERQGVNVRKTPDSILQAQLNAWNTVIDGLSSDAFFKEVVESQRAWARRVVAFRHEYEVSTQVAYDHFFRRT